jgi:aryl-alcohol dehydrogenase-like predicted oxidoreductase
MENDIIVPLRELGKSSIKVAPIGLGTWQFSGEGWLNKMLWNPIPQEQAFEIIKAAFNNGINLFDTAEIYGFGDSENTLAKGLKIAGAKNKDVTIATKWMPYMRFAGNIRKTISKRQSVLSPYSIDLYQIHQPTSFSSIKDQMIAMADLVKAGNIRNVGVSNFSALQMREAHEQLAKHGITLTSNQVKYNLLDRSIESNGVLAAAKELGMTIIAYSPLEMGLLTGKFHKDPKLLDSRPKQRRSMLQKKLEESRELVDKLESIGKKYDATASQIALNWLIHAMGDTIVAISGASKVSHVKESTGAMKFILSNDEIQQIDELSKKINNNVSEN